MCQVYSTTCTCPTSLIRRPLMLNSKYTVIGWSARLILFLVVLISILLLLLYFALRSNDINQKALTQLRPQLRSMGFEVEKVDYVAIDLLGQIDIRGINLRSVDDEQDEKKARLQLVVNKLSSRFALSTLLSGVMQVDSIKADGVKLVFQQPLSIDSANQEETSSEPFTIAELESFLSEPALPVIVKELDLRNISLDLELINKIQNVQIRQILNLHSRLNWNDNHLTGMLDFDLKPPSSPGAASFKFSQTEGQDLLDISFNPNVNNKLEWQLDYSETPWRLNVETAKQEIHLDDVQLQQHASQGVSKINPGRFNLNLTSQINSNNNIDSDTHGMRGIFPLNVESMVHSDGELMLDKTGENQFSTTLTHNLQLTFEQVLNADLLTNTESLLNQFSLNTSLQLQLNKSRFEQALAHGNSNNAQLKINASTDRSNVNQPLNFTSDATVDGSDIHFQQQLPSLKDRHADIRVNAMTSVEARFRPAFKLTLNGSVSTPEQLWRNQLVDYKELLASTSAILQLDATTEDISTTLFYADNTREQLALDQQKLKISVQADAGVLSLQEKLKLQQLSVSNLQYPLDLSQEFYLEAETKQLDDLTFDGFGKLNSSQVHFKQTSNDNNQINDSSTLSLQATPSFTFSTRGRLSNLQALEKLPMGSDMHFNQLLQVSDFSLVIPQDNTKPVRISSPKDEVFIVGDLSDDQYNIRAKMSLKNLGLTPLAKPINILQRISLKGDTQWQKARIGVKTYLDEKPLLAIDLPITNRPKELQFEPKVTAFFERNLKQIHHSAKDVLNETGELEVLFTGDTTVSHNADNAVDLDFTKLLDWPLSTNGDLSIKQNSNPTESQLQLYSPVKVQYKLALDRNKNPSYLADINLDTATIKYPPIEAPLTINTTMSSRFNWPLDVTTADGVINISEKPFLNYRLSVIDKPEKLNIESHWQLDSSPQLAQSLSTLQPLELIGSTSLGFDLNGDVGHPYSSLIEMTEKLQDLDTLLPSLSGNISLIGRLSQSPENRGSQLKLYKPLKFSQNFRVKDQKLALAGNIQAPSFALEDQFAAKSADISFNAVAAPVNQPNSIVLDVQLKPAEVTLTTAVEPGSTQPKLGHLITPLALNLSTVFNKNYSNIKLNSFQLKGGDGLLEVSASGGGATQSGDGQLEMLIKSRLKPDMWLKPQIGGSGELALPMDLTLLGGKRATLGGKLELTKLSLEGENWAVNGANGSLVIEEELEITPEQGVSFLYTLDTDPFQRVDYARIQPYLDDRSQFSISQMAIDEKNIGPLTASLSVRQNLVHLQKLDLALFGGHLAGQLYADTKPGAWKFGLLGRFNNVRLNELLQESSSLKGMEENPVNARVAVEFDLNLFLLEGRIDISDISVLQLMQLLELIDPEYQDEQLSQVRSLLGVASPQWISIDMRRGLMDLEIALTTVPTTIKINALPLTPLLRQFAGVYLQELQQLPLVSSGSE